MSTVITFSLSILCCLLYLLAFHSTGKCQKYYPDESLYWKQGKSTETDFIFVTTSFVTVEQLDKIHSEMKENESLLICAKSFASECEKRFANITVRKIPQMILGKCEFSKDNYDLNIINATKAEAEGE